jgi:hypothetical protein
MNKHYLVLLLFNFIFFGTLFSQENDTLTTSVKKNEERFFNTTYGLCYSSFRDEATSPLFYNGSGLNIGIGSSKYSEKFQNELNFDLNLTANLSKIPDNQLYPQKKVAFFFNLPLYFHHIRFIEKYSTQKMKVYLGGAFVSNFNSRINPNLQNAAAGIEFLENFMLSSKVSFDISRTTPKNLKIWFLKKTFKPKERTLNLKLNIGILNFNYRPNYAYLSDSEINGSSTNWVKYYLNGYQLKMNGWALSSALEYERLKESGNRIKWSYNWSAYSAPGRFEPFQMAHHSVKFTLMFKR